MVQEAVKGEGSRHGNLVRAPVGWKQWGGAPGRAVGEIESGRDEVEDGGDLAADASEPDSGGQEAEAGVARVCNAECLEGGLVVAEGDDVRT